MSYQVIARKWRSKTFLELVGQEHISVTLLNALKTDRLAHALLFTGPRGTGKTSVARILAKSIRCVNVKDFVPCGKCSICEEIGSGTSVDVIEIDGASNNGVDSIRELRETVAYMPSSGKWKVYIVDEVHMLSTSAFNALLKTLEEPPAHVIFILATTEVQKIPATILSRCQRYDFRRIPLKQIVQHLEKICTAEGVEIESAALWMIARQSEGSMRDSQSLLDQVINFCNKKVTNEKVIEMLGLTDRALVMNTISGLVARDSKTILTVIEKVFRGGFDAKIFCQEILEELRNLLMVKMAGPQLSALVDLPESEIEFLKAQAQNLSSEDIHLLFDMALKGAGDLFRAQDGKLVLEMILLRMAEAPRVQNITSLLEQMKNGAPTSAIISAPTPTPVSASIAAPASLAAPTPIVAPLKHVAYVHNENHYQEKWIDFVHKIKNLNALIGAKLENTHLLKVEGDQLTIGIPQSLEFLHSQANEPEFLKKVANYLTTFWGKNYRIEVVIEDKASKLSPKAHAEKEQIDQAEVLRQQIENHPLVQTVQKQLKTKIQAIKELT
ncbi:MAG: DNA polymerase III subunit gamma/tau [Pseudomonadota bacterium]|nr:DNA polymerase III subunit gamma/tau [Pseudomonadota bacterium]